MANFSIGCLHSGKMQWQGVKLELAQTVTFSFFVNDCTHSSLTLYRVTATTFIVQLVLQGSANVTNRFNAH